MHQCVCKNTSHVYLAYNKVEFFIKCLVVKYNYSVIGAVNRNSTFPNTCGEALLAKREFMARAEGECRNEFR